MQQVTRLEQMKTDMIRIAAHDLRNPLTVLNGYIEMLMGSDAISEEDAKFYLNQMHDSVHHMQRMVGDLLSLERIAELSGGHTDPVEFSLLVEDSFNRLFSTDHDMSLHVPNEQVIVYGVAPLLREAVDNLISNAVKYTPANGTITATLSADSDYAFFRVVDTGYGIPEDMQNDLFKPFYRAKSKETRKIPGTGLGLNLVQNIVARHNGTIHFLSEYGKGSEFGFLLPCFNDQLEGQS